MMELIRSAVTRTHVISTLTLALTCYLVSGQDSSDLVNVKWGVADSTATVGRLFHLHIPSDAFIGPVQSFSIKPVDGAEIPEWLEFDSKDNVLRGIPCPKDVTNQLFLEIFAKGPANVASSTFSIVVRDDPSHTSGAPLRFKKAGPEVVRCKRHEPETVATIILDVDVEHLPAPERMALLNRFLGHMDLHEDMVKILPVGQSPMHDSSALVSGSGDCPTPQTFGTFVKWPVGCGQVKTGHFPILQRLDDDSGNGRMSQVLKYPIIGWHVTNSHIQAPKRKRRQVQATRTASLTPVMPSMTEKIDDGEEKMTRTVIDMSSPVINPTATQPEMPKTEDPGMPVKPTTPMLPTKEETPAIKPTESSKDGGSTETLPPVKEECQKDKNLEVGINKINLGTVREGDVIDYVIPENTFTDCKVAVTRDLELHLFRNRSIKTEPDFFLQLDTTNGKQKLVGLPMMSDVRKAEYNMNLMGKKSLQDDKFITKNIVFSVEVKKMKNNLKKKINHELGVAIDMDYKEFKSDASNTMALATKVASVFGDPDASNLVITKLEAGSVIFGWANKSVASSGCPVGDVTNMVDKLVNEDGTIKESAKEKLKPFKLGGMSSKPKGKCEGVPGFPTKDIVLKKEEPVTKTTMTDPPKTDKDTVTYKTDDSSKTTTKKEDEANVGKGSLGGDDDDDIWITTVVPAVVIVVILLIALLVACLLYRKKRKGKMNVEEQNTFVNKGAPVIFPDELGDKPNDVNKPLLVEGNASPPPVYHRGPSESPERNNHSGSGHNGVTAPPYDEVIQEYPERPYEPPAPPVTGSSNNKQPRPTHQQQPFSQPPQILP